MEEKKKAKRRKNAEGCSDNNGHLDREGKEGTGKHRFLFA